MNRIEDTTLESARKHFIRSLVILGFAILYTVSPVDFIPEAILGPLGYLEDIPILLSTALYAGYTYRKMKKERERTIKKGRTIVLP